jgi:hypothetical protein
MSSEDQHQKPAFVVIDHGEIDEQLYQDLEREREARASLIAPIGDGS